MAVTVGLSGTAGRDVLTTGQVGKMLHVAPRTVARWMALGKLRGYRLPGSDDRRFCRADVEAFARAEGFPPAMLGFPDAVLVAAPGRGLSALREPGCWPEAGGRPSAVFAADPWEAARLAAELDVRGVAIDRAALGSDLARVVYRHSAALPGAPPVLVLLPEDGDPAAWAGPGVTVLRGPLDPAAVAGWRAGLSQGGGS